MDERLRLLERTYRQSYAWADWLAWAEEAKRSGEPAGTNLVLYARRLQRNQERINNLTHAGWDVDMKTHETLIRDAWRIHLALRRLAGLGLVPLSDSPGFLHDPIGAWKQRRARILPNRERRRQRRQDHQAAQPHIAAMANQMARDMDNIIVHGLTGARHAFSSRTDWPSCPSCHRHNGPCLGSRGQDLIYVHSGRREAMSNILIQRATPTRVSRGFIIDSAPRPDGA